MRCWVPDCSQAAVHADQLPTENVYSQRSPVCVLSHVHTAWPFCAAQVPALLQIPPTAHGSGHGLVLQLCVSAGAAVAVQLPSPT